MAPTLENIIKASGIHPSRVFNVYLFGSRVYNTFDHNSDWDIIMVANNSVESTELRKGLFNIHVYTPDKFKSDLDWHRINNLECIFAPKFAKLKESISYDNFKIDKSKLRHAISHISSNSWVKAKKKLTLTDDYKIGIKSLFHSIRIPMFATQIIKEGSITDFEVANYIWLQLNRYGERWNWEQLNNEFKTIKNLKLAEFREVTNK